MLSGPVLRVITAILIAMSTAQPNPPATLTVYPVSRCKMLYLVRHAEGYHNQAKAQAEREGTHTPPAAVLWENTTGRKYWDAKLTPEGEKQCDDARLKMLVSPAAFSEPELVLVSPLTRTLQTATLLFKAGSRQFVASELCREKVDVYVCEGRRNVTELRPEFGHVDFSAVETNQDSWFYDNKEDDAAVQARAMAFLELIRSRKEQTIAVVSHKKFLQNLLKAASIHDQPTQRIFANAEVRAYQLCDFGQSNAQNKTANTSGSINSSELQSSESSKAEL
eukprot:TRINITY_DN44859_c0_g1_i1.p1 TRINITY_DN44859_c0_g1~~TRINITY_DN44859_c0_g1_i1.p1  ORF type:complete len:279 (-),score=72.35 TRINITY_DN44859_c0_g1_i1:367-1203(-)